MYPTIASWLRELDNGTRGIDDYNFQQYGTALDRHGYCHVNQFWEESGSEAAIEKLAEHCEMPIGVAKLLTKYTMVDCRWIQVVEKQKWVASK